MNKGTYKGTHPDTNPTTNEANAFVGQYSDTLGVKKLFVGGITPTNNAITLLDDYVVATRHVPELNSDISKGIVNGAVWVTRNASFGTTGILDIAHNGLTGASSTFLAVGGTVLTGNATVRSSTDAITWTTVTFNFPSFVISNTVTYANGLWVVAGESGDLSTSTNTTTWVARTPNFGTSTIVSIAYGNGLFIAVGDGGGMSKSTDTINWVTQESNFGSSNIYNITYSNGIFLAVGDGGVIKSSADGSYWIDKNANFGATRILGVAYGNDKWVAVGDTGVLTSTYSSGLPTINLGNNIFGWVKK